MNEVERKIWEVIDRIASTGDQPTDLRAWDNLLIYIPRESIERRLARLTSNNQEERGND